MTSLLSTRRSGLTLVFLGLLGTLFFWMTDPHFGPLGHPVSDMHRTVDWRHWLFMLRGSPDNLVDAANQDFTGSIVGIVGSLVVLCIGFWLLTRRRT